MGSTAEDARSASGVLGGLTVIEAADTPAAAFAAALAGDFGATVVVCEPPPSGSGIRRLGPPSVQRVWWPILARNKLSLALDTKHPEAPSLIRSLVQRADILVRDDCERGLELHAQANASGGVVDVHLYPPGSDRPDLWPWSVEPEFAAAATGVMALTGMPAGPAAQPEMPLADYAAGMMALTMGLAELRAARRGARQAVPVSVGLHEALHRMCEWNVAVASCAGRAERRNGNRFPMNANIGNIFRTRDGKLLTVSAATPAVAERLLQMIGGAALKDDPRFRTAADRRLNMDALDEIIAEWMGRHDADEAMRLVRENEVVVGPINDAADVLRDPDVQERGDIVRFGNANGTALAMPAALPRIERTPGRTRSLGPAVGADTTRFLNGLGYSTKDIDHLRRSGVVWS